MAEKECLFTSLIVDPDLGCRARLREATKAVSTFGAVVQCSKLDEALPSLKDQGTTDVVFISSRFDEALVQDFIKQAKKAPETQLSAFVLMLDSTAQKGTNAAEIMLKGGADGLLFEPFSIDQLVEITQLAARVRKDRSRQREEQGVKMLVKQAIPLIVSLAELKGAGYEAKKGIKNLEEISNVLKTLDPALLEYYYMQAVELFEAAPPPPPEKKGLYGGASKRVRQKIEEKLLAKLSEELPAEDEPK